MSNIPGINTTHPDLFLGYYILPKYSLLCLLQVLLSYCDSFAKDNDVKYNAKKTVCMFVRLKSDFVPCVELSGFKLKCVPTHKYLGFHIATDRRDDRSIRQQCRNMYSRGNTIIRNFKHCSDAVKCQLFKSFCTSFYCASLWSSYTIESLRHLKVAYNRIFPYPDGFTS